MLAVLPSTITDTIPNATPTTTVLQMIANQLGLSTYWVQEQLVMARRVARVRRYYDGDHDVKLTSQMRKTLQVKDEDDGMAINLMASVVDTKSDRCVVQSIEGVEDKQADTTEQPGEKAAPQIAAPKKPVTNAVTTWAQEVSDNNDFDIVQGEQHEQTIRDGNGYLMVEWDNDKKQSVFTIEPAWDGQSGMLMVYKSRNIDKPYAAIKIWQIDDVAPSGTATATGVGTLSITTRMNVYYEDRVEKFIAKGFATAFEPFTDKGEKSNVLKWDMVDGKPIGIPVVHFRNAGRNNYGVSELRNAIPIQNALNRFHYSSVMAAELTAFAIYLELGLNRDTDAVTPGMTIQIPGPIPNDQQVDFKKIPGSDIKPILEMIDSERRLIAEVTRTPSPDLASGSGSNKSGEFLKQLEVGLIGKVRRFTTRAGASWELAFVLAWKIQQAYGTLKPPAYKRFLCRWQSPEIRNDAEIITNAVAAAPFMGKRQTLRNMAEPYELDEQKIEDIMQEDQAAAGNRLAALVGNMPSFSNFNAPTQQTLPGMALPAVAAKPNGLPMNGGLAK